MKAKVFAGNSEKSLEEQLNDWLDQHPKAEIKHMGQSVSGSAESDWSAVVVILFDEPNKWDHKANKL